MIISLIAGVLGAASGIAAVVSARAARNALMKPPEQAEASVDLKLPDGQTFHYKAPVQDIGSIPHLRRELAARIDGVEIGDIKIGGKKLSRLKKS